MSPIDYSGAFAAQDPSATLMEGIKNGVAIRGIQDQRALAEQAKLRDAAMRADLAELSANPTAAKIGQYSLKYPQLSEQFKRSYDMFAPEEKAAKLNEATQIFTAFNSDKPDVGLRLMRDKAKALRNAGDERGAGATEAMAQVFEMDPNFAKVNMGNMLAAMAGPEKFAAAYGNMGDEARAKEQAPATLSKAEAEAMKAGVEAQVAQDTAGIKVQQAREDVETTRDKRRIAQLDTEIQQADSETKRGQLILERDKLIDSQRLKALETGEAAQSQVDSAQHALNTISSLLADPLMKDTTGNTIAGIGTGIGRLLAYIPGTENKDFRGQLESLKSQVFLPAVQQIKGMGALSNAEGEKLTAAVAALDPDMSKTAFRNAMGVVERYMTKGLQKGLSSKAIPVQGGGFVVNHPTFGPVKEGDVNRLMKQFPGATRDQVLQYLNSTGAK